MAGSYECKGKNGVCHTSRALNLLKQGGGLLVMGLPPCFFGTAAAEKLFRRKQLTFGGCFCAANPI